MPVGRNHLHAAFLVRNPANAAQGITTLPHPAREGPTDTPKGIVGVGAQVPLVQDHVETSTLTGQMGPRVATEPFAGSGASREEGGLAGSSSDAPTHIGDIDMGEVERPHQAVFVVLASSRDPEVVRQNTRDGGRCAHQSTPWRQQASQNRN